MALPDPASLRALLLDLDDTILDDRSGILAAWQAVVGFACERRAGLDAEALRAAIAEVTGWYWSEPERERRGRLDLLRARREIIAGALERIDRADAELAAEAARVYTAQREACYRMAVGAREALESLRRRFACLALVTNGAAGPQRAKIERFGLAAFFDHIQVEGEFGLGKPEPRVYAHAAAALGVAAGECLFAGDNYRADVLGPLAAGMHAAWIDVEQRGRPPFAPPRLHATVRSLAELTRRLTGAPAGGPE